MRSTIRNSHKAVLFYEPQLGETPLSDDNKCWSSFDHKTIKAMLVDITGKPSRAAQEGMLFKGREGTGGGSDTGSRDINLHLHLTAKNLH